MPRLLAGGVALLDLAEQHAVFANPEDVEAIDEFIMSSTGVHLVLPIYFRPQLFVYICDAIGKTEEN